MNERITRMVVIELGYDQISPESIAQLVRLFTEDSWKRGERVDQVVSSEPTRGRVRIEIHVSMAPASD